MQELLVLSRFPLRPSSKFLVHTFYTRHKTFHNSTPTWPLLRYPPDILLLLAAQSAVLRQIRRELSLLTGIISANSFAGFTYLDCQTNYKRMTFVDVSTAYAAPMALF